MEGSFIGAVVAMLVLTAFSFIVLKASAIDTGSKIRDSVIRQIQSYDSLIQRKSSELNAITKKVEEKNKELLKDEDFENKAQTAFSEVVLPDHSEYLNNSFFTDYKRIRENFVFSRSEIIRVACDSVHEHDTGSKNVLFDGLADKFNFDNVYKLSALNQEEQLEVAGEIMTEDEKVLLDEFMENRAEFNGIDFYQWLYAARKLNDNVIHIKTSEMHEAFSIPGKISGTEYDGNICEGFQILCGNRLYDYGIRRFELI